VEKYKIFAQITKEITKIDDIEIVSNSKTGRQLNKASLPLPACFEIVYFLSGKP
jgi:hypothetical protein